MTNLKDPVKYQSQFLPDYLSDRLEKGARFGLEKAILDLSSEKGSSNTRQVPLANNGYVSSSTYLAITEHQFDELTPKSEIENLLSESIEVAEPAEHLGANPERVINFVLDRKTYKATMKMENGENGVGFFNKYEEGKTYDSEDVIRSVIQYVNIKKGMEDIQIPKKSGSDTDGSSMGMRMVQIQERQEPPDKPQGQ